MEADSSSQETFRKPLFLCAMPQRRNYKQAKVIPKRKP